MKKLRFKSSAIASIGIELEIQLINPETGALKPSAKTLIRNVSESPFQKNIKPEITQSMVEINSTIHFSMENLYQELIDVRRFLLTRAAFMGIRFAGGGTHPFQRWPTEKIFPLRRFKNLTNVYRYLSKRSTVFGQHVHVGCNNAEDALYLTHALACYVPQMIALASSSPFYQGVDTGYHSSRLTVFNAFPFSGVIPYLLTWQEFTAYYQKMYNLGIIHSMKDFYWDIRPKPEFGTVEIRVCDTPLTLKKVVLIATFVQALSLYLLQERPYTPNPDLYQLYTYNRFQACRYGYEGELINPFTLKRSTIHEELLQSMQHIEKYAKQLNNFSYFKELQDSLLSKENDANLLRKIYKEKKSLPALIAYQSDLWEGEKWKKT